MHNSLYKILGINSKNRTEKIDACKKIGISAKRIAYYNSNGILPSGSELESILKFADISKEELMLRMGIYDHKLRKIISENSAELLSKIAISDEEKSNLKKPTPIFKTKLGRLYQGDCLSYLKTVDENSFDLIFADPPFNLKKLYLSNIDDNLSSEEYINWTEDWLTECVRTLKDGGSLFLWNLPKWNTYFSHFLNHRLNFRHWIATDIKYSLPIGGRLYPSHYSLLYYTKGDAVHTFHPDRLPMEICPKCYSDLKDYGGYKDKMNPLGINISDIWYDIPPVRHRKYKRREEANELSIKLLDRIIEMSSNVGDVVFDPFGGSGTTYIVSELKRRKWVGIELGPIDSIVDRFNLMTEEQELLNKYRSNYNQLFTAKSKAKRNQLKLWTDETVREKVLADSLII